MEIKVIATTNFGHIAEKEEFEKMAGLTAGVCYLSNTIDELFLESEIKTMNRTNSIKESGHHSPFDHPFINLEINDIPKIIAMYINNEKVYTTSEKSARYRRMELEGEEKEYYNKWLEIFKQKIADRYQEKYPEIFGETAIKKLAQENARYLTSVFTPTSMVYSVSYRQINILYSIIAKEIDIVSKRNDPFSIRLKVELEKFNQELEKTGYIDEKLSKNVKNRYASFVKRDIRPVVKYFGDVYCSEYKGSFAQLAQAQRHRTLNYTAQIPNVDEMEFYVPPILKDDENLVSEWKEDCKKLANNYPQATLIDITEMGTLDDFILKTKERLCKHAQLEIDQQTALTLKEYYKELKANNHPRAEEVEKYTHGSRCTFPDYKCTNPCKFPEGVTGERKI